jgi:hypothetical protein
MKILYINIYMHTKNNNALLNYKNINFYIINHTNIDSIDLTQFNCVYSPSQPIDVKKYPNTKFIFGPHFSVLPENNIISIVNNKNVVYVQPSTWVVNLWKRFPICQHIRIESLPFGVDTLKFNEIKHINHRSKVFLYFKRRDPNELNSIINFLKTKNIHPKIFSYANKYDENEYINYLHDAKFGFWLDAHESQGFALEEALSCNVPLLVWNVTSLNQEHGSNYPNAPATTIPYWDERCGEYFTDIHQLETTFNKFITNLTEYKPREYILENISMEKCEEKIINLINNV